MGAGTDSAELGKAIATYPDNLETALSEYEKALFPRSEAVAVEAHETPDLRLGDNAPIGLIDLITGSGSGSGESQSQSAPAVASH